jgi:hypothetical protein
VTGQRLPDESDWSIHHAPGSYWKRGSTWFAITPNGHLGNLAGHTVTEHEDGTITVSPSILVSTTKNVELWHGFLERGVWRSC